MSTTLLPPGSAVELELGAHGDHHARAEWCHHDRLGVSVPGPLPVLASALVGGPAAVVFPTPRGLHRVDATVVAAARGGVLELLALTAAQVAQRREHVRVSAPLHATVQPADAAHPPLHTFTVDLSGAGVLLAGAGPVERGDLVSVTVRVPGGDAPVAAPSSRVVRRGATGHVAVAFGGLERADRERVVRYVFERQREERRAARQRR
jgi:hypothetical protein